MQSWVISGTKKLTLHNEEATEENLKINTKVKIARAALCQSDIASYENKFENLPIIPCRSALALVSESKNGLLRKGQRVFLSPYLSDDQHIYIKGKDIDGYLSDFATVSNSNVCLVPDSISDEAFTFIEDIAMCLKTVKLLEVSETDYVLLYGATALNIIMAQLCIYHQAIPIIIDSDADSLAKAEEYGVYYCINSKIESVYERIIEITTGALVNHLVVDIDAYPEINPDILKYVALKGKVALLGYNTCVEKINVDISFVIGKRLSIFGINDGISEIEPAINMLAMGIVKVDNLIDKMYDFSEVQQAFLDADSKKMRFKTIVRC